MLVLLVLAIYSPAIDGGYIWDDDSYLTQNTNLVSADGLRRIWLEPSSSPQYYPLVFSSFWVERRLWGLNPRGYHLVNVLLHALNAILIWFLLRRLAVPLAWLAAAIFAFHPVHVESVAWITERKNVLSTALYLGAALCYLRFIGWGQKAEKAAKPLAKCWGVYALSLALFGGALLAKSVTASLPAALLLAVWWRRGRIGWRDVAPLAPLFLMGAAFGLHTTYLEKHHVGASGPDWDFSLLQRCLIAGRVAWFYAGKLAWPDPLIFFYPRWRIDAAQVGAYLYPLGVIAVVVLLWARRRQGRGALTAVLFFLGTLVPVSGFFNVYPMRFSFVADHFQYLASLGPIALFSGALGQRFSRLPPRRAISLVPVAAAALLLVLGALSWRQARIYANDETLWRATLANNPEAFVAHDSLGLILEGQGNLLEAGWHYEQAIKIKPDDAYAYLNLGVLAEKQRNPDRAQGLYQEALRIDPNLAKAHNNLGILLSNRGDIVSAKSHFEQALRIKPDFAEAHNNLGSLLAPRSDLTSAKFHFEEAVRIMPEFAVAQRNLGMVLQKLGQYAEADAHLQRARVLQPDLFRPR